MPSGKRYVSPFDEMRHKLVDHLRSKGITDNLVLKAIDTVPRERFVPQAIRARSYEDTALPIDDRQTISQPYTVAFMTQALMPAEGMRVLEVGTGSGYQSAVLSAIGCTVVSIERLPRLSLQARTILAKLGYNVACRIGDGTIGWREGAPYDGIIVTAGAPDVPEPLARQLAIGGRMVVPVGSQSEQTLYRVTRTADEHWNVEDLGPFKFVPLIGVEGWTDEQ